MQVIRSREIVIEFEQVTRSQRRALTSVARCDECGGESDFLSIGEAVNLFRTPAETLLGFVNENACHFLTGTEGTIFVCVASLMTSLKDRPGRLTAG